MMVNYRHIGYSSNLKILKAVAYFLDKIDEVVEDSNKKFYIEVQFHHESLYKKDKNINNIFKEFIKVCGQKNNL